MTPAEALGTVLDEEHAQGVIDHRKALKRPLTALAAKLLAAQFARCDDPNAAAEAMLIAGWRGFKPEWLKNGNGNSNAGAGASSPSADLMRSFGIRPSTEH